MWTANCGSRRMATRASRSGSRTAVSVATFSAAGRGPHCRTLTSGLPLPDATVKAGTPPRNALKPSGKRGRIHSTRYVNHTGWTLSHLRSSVQSCSGMAWSFLRRSRDGSGRYGKAARQHRSYHPLSSTARAWEATTFRFDRYTIRAAASLPVAGPLERHHLVRLAACARLNCGPEHRVWFRAFDPKHVGSPLGTAHTAGVPNRFSPGPAALKPFVIYYLTESHVVCLREVEALMGSSRIGPVPLVMALYSCRFWAGFLVFLHISLETKHAPLSFCFSFPLTSLEESAPSPRRRNPSTAVRPRTA
jgi:hypothetical protein